MNAVESTRHKLRQLLAFNAAEPALGRIASVRSTAAYNANKQHLEALKGHHYARTLRATTLAPMPAPAAAWIIRHHLREAKRVLCVYVTTLNAPLNGVDAALYGGPAHRIKLVRNIPTYLRDRLDPAFSKGDLWDPEGTFERRFDNWEQSLLSRLPPKPTPAKTWWPHVRDTFLNLLPSLEHLLDEMLDMFGEAN